MQVDLEGDGSFLFTSDQFHVAENYTKKIPQGRPPKQSLESSSVECAVSGFLGRDRNAWLQSTHYVERIEEVLKAKIIYGHDMPTFKAMKQIPEFYH